LFYQTNNRHGGCIGNISHFFSKTSYRFTLIKAPLKPQKNILGISIAQCDMSHIVAPTILMSYESGDLNHRDYAPYVRFKGRTGDNV